MHHLDDLWHPEMLKMAEDTIKRIVTTFTRHRISAGTDIMLKILHPP